jgi:hypothetical protein
MTTDDQDETMAAVVRPDGMTAAPEPEPDEPETTIVAADTTAAPELAWSVGEQVEEFSSSTYDLHPWARVLAIAATTVLGAVFLAIVLAVNGHHDADLHESALPVTTTVSATVGKTSAPVVTTVTTTAVPPPEDKDAQFISLLKKAGMTTHPDTFVWGRAVCDLRREGYSKDSIVRSTLNNVASGKSGWITEKDAETSLDIAIEVYCPEYGATP